ncbi:hypothetical protein KSP40_PGU005975 [Platanthera guangdongensis]|uniref:WAT1-related protein n=1 Tax=Platanthera guangdongensis TaxID=2320717 RepID=A0ABR2LW22_9ASPA
MWVGSVIRNKGSRETQIAMDDAGEVEPSQILSLLAAVSYGLVSMAMVFINKAVLMKYSYSMTLLMLQQLATALLIHFGRIMGYTRSSSLNLATAKKLLPLSLFYNANVAFALASLKGVNIPMYIALKRLTPLAVLVAGFFSGKGRPPVQPFKGGMNHQRWQCCMGLWRWAA